MYLLVFVGCGKMRRCNVEYEVKPEGRSNQSVDYDIAWPYNVIAENKRANPICSL